MIERLQGSNEVLRGRKVLVDDDDIRNIFALTTVLENHKMEVKGTTNGRQAHRQFIHLVGLRQVLPKGSKLDRLCDSSFWLFPFQHSLHFRPLPISINGWRGGSRSKCRSTVQA